jgi:hypothetical protein
LRNGRNDALQRFGENNMLYIRFGRSLIGLGENTTTTAAAAAMLHYNDVEWKENKNLICTRPITRVLLLRTYTSLAAEYVMGIILLSIGSLQVLRRVGQ